MSPNLVELKKCVDEVARVLVFMSGGIMRTHERMHESTNAFDLVKPLCKLLRGSENVKELFSLDNSTLARWEKLNILDFYRKRDSAMRFWTKLQDIKRYLDANTTSGRR